MKTYVKKLNETSTLSITIKNSSCWIIQTLGSTFKWFYSFNDINDFIAKSIIGGDDQALKVDTFSSQYKRNLQLHELVVNWYFE